MNAITQINIMFWITIISTALFLVLSIYHLGRIGINKLFFRRYDRLRSEEKIEEITTKLDHLTELLYDEKVRTKKD